MYSQPVINAHNSITPHNLTYQQPKESASDMCTHTWNEWSWIQLDNNRSATDHSFCHDDCVWDELTSGLI